MSGTYQLDLDFYRCRDDPELYTSPDTANKIIGFISEAGFRVCSHTCYHYPKSDGFALLVAIAESHVAVSTWPEHCYVQITIASCSHTRNNTPIARKLEGFLRKLYRPKRIIRASHPRGPKKKYL